MKLLHNIGPRLMSNYNTIDEIMVCDDDISFDGIYLNVWDHRNHLVAWRTKYPNRSIYLFVQGHNIGTNNWKEVESGAVPRIEAMCDWNQIVALTQMLGAKLGWHTQNHPDLTQLTDEQVIKEITPPFPMHYFAYPYGNVDERVQRIVHCSSSYRDAWSVTQGTGELFSRKRSYLNW